VKIHLPSEHAVLQADHRGWSACVRFSVCRAFSLVEVLVVVTLLSLIVLVLMTVFNSTQSAFRAGVTQSDVMEGGRAAMDLMVSDLKTMTATGNSNNILYSGYGDYRQCSANFYANTNFNNYQPLLQSLPGSSQLRTNLLENFFMLSRQNINGHDTWVGTGYTVNATNASPIFPLYRFTTNAPVSSDPYNLLNTFILGIQANAYTNTGWSHLIDGVVDLRVRAIDVNGYQMTNTYQYNSGQYTTYPNTWFGSPQWGEPGFCFFSNSIPSTVEVQMGALEDRIVKRAESLPPQTISPTAQSNYLAQQAGSVHVFRQRVLIPNVDANAYP
jgi:prepilin-type N-terminal cleavage/methylation domain-containing protein